MRALPFWPSLTSLTCEAALFFSHVTNRFFIYIFYIFIFHFGKEQTNMVELKFQSKTKKRCTSVAYIDGETIGNVQLCNCLTLTANLYFLLVSPLSQGYMFYIVGIERVKIWTKAEKGTFLIRQTLIGRVYRELQVRFSNGLRRMFYCGLCSNPTAWMFYFWPVVLYVSLMLNTRCCKCVSLTCPSRFTKCVCLCVCAYVCVCVSACSVTAGAE